MRIAIRIGWLVFLVALLLRIIVAGPKSAANPLWPIVAGVVAGLVVYLFSRRQPDPPVRITRDA